MPRLTGQIKIALIVAVAENGIIGRDGGLPWRLSSDLKRFRQLTIGKPVIMGRKTFDSIGKPLDGRENIVVTRSADFRASGIRVAASVEDALAAGRASAAASGADEVMVIGGAEIYAATMPQADRIYLTRVHAIPKGDAIFAAPDPGQWRETSSEHHAAGPKDDHDWTLIVLERR